MLVYLTSNHLSRSVFGLLIVSTLYLGDDFDTSASESIPGTACPSCRTDSIQCYPSHMVRTPWGGKSVILIVVAHATSALPPKLVTKAGIHSYTCFGPHNRALPKRRLPFSYLIAGTDLEVKGEFTLSGGGDNFSPVSKQSPEKVPFGGRL